MTAKADPTTAPADNIVGRLADLDHRIEDCARQIQLAGLAYELSASRLQFAVRMLDQIRGDLRSLHAEASAVAPTDPGWCGDYRLPVVTRAEGPA